MLLFWRSGAYLFVQNFSSMDDLCAKIAKEDIQVTVKPLEELIDREGKFTGDTGAILHYKIYPKFPK